MSDAVAWVNANAGVLTLSFSFVVTVATVFYVLLTRELVRETRLVREAQVQPHISVRVELNQVAFGFCDLVVENMGVGPAYDVAFSYSPDLELETNPRRHLSSIGFLQAGFRYLAPRQEVRTFLMSLIGVEDSRLKGEQRITFTVTVGYRDSLRKEYSERFTIDFAHFAGLMTLGTPPLPSIAKSLEKIQDSVSKLSTGWSKLKVVQYTPDDIAREHDSVRLAQLSRQIIDEALPDPDTEPPAPGAA
jgi:hypothetical protein